MATDDLSGEIAVFTRAESEALFAQLYQIAEPEADVGPGTMPARDARVAADMMVVVFADAQTIGDTSSLRSRNDAQLDAIGEVEGVERPPATGASGYLVVDAAEGGTTIFADDEVKHLATGNVYRVTKTALYSPGSLVPVIGKTTGPETDLAAGAELQWLNPRAGCAPTATVWEEGLTGGREQASREEYIELIIDRRRNPPAAGNDGAYQAFVQNVRQHGIAVQKCFTYPAIKGTGTTGLAFVLRPARPGGSRLPNGAQIAIMEAALEGEFPGDDGIFLAQVAEQATTIALGVTWRKSAVTWADQNPWPAWIPLSPMAVSGAAAISASAFRVSSSESTDAPIAGQTIAVYNAAQARFARKQIATVTEIVAGKTWDLTFDLTGNASDTAFAPAAGALVSPWSDSLDVVAPAVVAYCDALGPGEMVATFYDEGRRQRRQPENPEAWPSEISTRVEQVVGALDPVRTVTLLSPTSPAPTTVGVPGALVHLRRVTDLAVFEES